MTADVRVRDAFDALKVADLRVAPTFDSVQQRSSVAHVRPRSSLAFRLVAASVVVAAAAGAYATVTAKHKRFTVPSEVVALGAWRPATDALLPRTHGTLGAGPALGRSILDLDQLTTGAIR